MIRNFSLFFLCFIFYFQQLCSDSYLISYPRSGLHFTHYQLIYLSHKVCYDFRNKAYHYWDNGVLHKYGVYENKDDILLYLSHVSPEHLNSNTDKLILLLRNYRECHLRNLSYDLNRIVDVISMNRMYIPVNAYDIGSGYFTNLYAFDSFEGKKLIVYYEDLVAHPKEVITRIFNFLEVTPIDLDHFYDNLSQHRSECIQRYQIHGGSKSQGENMLFHSEKITASENEMLDDLVKKHHPILWDKYLNVYKYEIHPKI